MATADNNFILGAGIRNIVSAWRTRALRRTYALSGALAGRGTCDKLAGAKVAEQQYRLCSLGAAPSPRNSGLSKIHV